MNRILWRHWSFVHDNKQQRPLYTRYVRYVSSYYAVRRLEQLIIAQARRKAKQDSDSHVVWDTASCSQSYTGHYSAITVGLKVRLRVSPEVELKAKTRLSKPGRSTGLLVLRIASLRQCSRLKHRVHTNSKLRSYISPLTEFDLSRRFQILCLTKRWYMHPRLSIWRAWPKYKRF